MSKMGQSSVDTKTYRSVVVGDPDILGGVPVFVDTLVPLVPVKTLLDYLEAGDTIDEFLNHFPSVSQRQALTVLEWRTS